MRCQNLRKSPTFFWNHSVTSKQSVRFFQMCQAFSEYLKFSNDSSDLCQLELGVFTVYSKVHILWEGQNLKKSPTFFWNYLATSKQSGTFFFQICGHLGKTWTLKVMISQNQKLVRTCQTAPKTYNQIILLQQFDEFSDVILPQPSDFGWGIREVAADHDLIHLTRKA